MQLLDGAVLHKVGTLPSVLLQMSGWSGASSLHAEAGQAVRYRGMTDCFVRTVKEEGMKALFKVGKLVVVSPAL